MITKLYGYRFEFFLISQMAILFGSLIVPSAVFEFISPILFFINILAGGLFLVKQHKRRNWIIGLVLIIIGGLFILSTFKNTNTQIVDYVIIAVLFLFHILVTYKMITEIWKASIVDKRVIYGVMSGFISLGLIGFFICMSIEVIDPNSFQGLRIVNENSITEGLMYFSYITLLTIGYGDIVPITPLAHKATILIGLIGQFYLVIITGIVVGKFINQSKQFK